MHGDPPEWTGAQAMRTEILDGLELDWMGEPEEDRFDAFLTLPPAMRQRILAAALAPLLNTSLAGDGRIEGYEETVEALEHLLGATIARASTDYWSRLPKATIARLLADACGTATDPRVIECRKLKKGAAAEYAAERIAEDFPDWTVPGFRCDDEENE